MPFLNLSCLVLLRELAALVCNSKLRPEGKFLSLSMQSSTCFAEIQWALTLVYPEQIDIIYDPLFCLWMNQISSTILCAGVYSLDTLKLYGIIVHKCKDCLSSSLEDFSEVQHENLLFLKMLPEARINEEDSFKLSIFSKFDNVTPVLFMMAPMLYHRVKQAPGKRRIQYQRIPILHYDHHELKFWMCIEYCVDQKKLELCCLSQRFLEASMKHSSS